LDTAVCFVLQFSVCSLIFIARPHAKLSTPCLKKNQQNYFCYKYVKLPPNLTIFGKMMANCLKLHEVHSFSTSPNSRQCTTVLNADITNCYITL